MDKASHDPTMVNCILLQQAGSENHVMLIETFRDKAEYDAHAQAGYVRILRGALLTLLGSPYDERYGTGVVR